MRKRNFLMILQIRLAVLYILLDIRHFCCKKRSAKSRFWRGNIILCQINLLCKNCDFCLANSTNPRHSYIPRFVSLVVKGIIKNIKKIKHQKVSKYYNHDCSKSNVLRLSGSVSRPTTLAKIKNYKWKISKRSLI